MHNILIADDHPLFRDAIRGVLQEVFPEVAIIETESVAATLDETAKNPDIDLVLLDLNMDGMNGCEGIDKVRSAHPEIPVVIISSEESRAIVLETINHGAVGFISKSTDSKKVAEALRGILDGKVYLPPDIIRNNTQESDNDEQVAKNDDNPPLDPVLLSSLTRRQLIVLERIARGESNKLIAYELGIAETTVKAHVSTILSKLKLNNRIQAALRSSHLNFDQLLNRIN